MKKMMLLVFALLAMVNTADARRGRYGNACDPCPPKCAPCGPEQEEVGRHIELRPCTISRVVEVPGVTPWECVTSCKKDPCAGCMSPEAANAKYGDKIRSNTSGSMY